MKKSKLTLVKEKAKRQENRASWLSEYKCECGNTTFQRAHNVKNKIVRSCGCQRWKIKNTIPKSSQLTLIRRVESVGGRWYSEYKCSCGNKKILCDTLVRNGSTKSCGCRISKNKNTIPSDSHLTLIQEKFEKRGSDWYGKYKCVCGEIKLVSDGKVRAGETKSCGCQKIAMQKIAVTKHGMEGTRIYSIWVSMRRRCREREGYAGRGIRVCQLWEKSFIPFHEWSIKNGYTDKLQIDRKNNDGNYKPSNCQWTTVKVNSNNRRSNLGINKIKEIKTLLQFGFSTIMVREAMGGGAVSHIRAIRDGKIHSDVLVSE